MAIPSLKTNKSLQTNNTSPTTIEAPKDSIFTALVSEGQTNSLLKYAEGYPWTVNFFGQLINANNNLENFDPTAPNLAQPYYKVNGLILQVSSPLSSSYEQNTGITSVTGSAVTPYKLTPNVGDVFIAQVDTGEDAIFLITSVTRKTHRKDTLYEISYSLLNYTSVTPDVVVTLQSRVQDEYHFNPDTNYFNRDVLITPVVKKAIDDLKAFLYTSKEFYFETFSRRQTGGVLIPGVDYKLYDPHLHGILSKTVSYDVLAQYPFFRHTLFPRDENQITILDAIANRSVGMLKRSARKCAFLPTTLLMNKSRLGTARHANIDYALTPLEHPDISLVKRNEVIPRSMHLKDARSVLNYDITTASVNITTNNNDVYIKPILHELFVDDYYVVSENFYNYLTDKTQYGVISYIELLISRFLKSEAISKQDLAIAVANYQDWSPLHQLYLLPVMWLIIQSQL